MEDSLTDGMKLEEPADPPPAKESRFGNGPTAFFQAPKVSCRMSVIVMCMLATGTQLILRSVPFVATVGPDGMAATYDWDEKEVGWVFASFGWGCTCTAALFRGSAFSLNQGRRCTDALSQIPGSMLSVKYGAKYTWWVFLMGAGFFNFCVPIAGSLAPMFGFEPLYGVMLCRFMFGSFQGSLFPIQTSILAGWLHVKERSTITAAVGCCWSFFQVRRLCKNACKNPAANLCRCAGCASGVDAVLHGRLRLAVRLLHLLHVRLRLGLVLA